MNKVFYILAFLLIGCTHNCYIATHEMPGIEPTIRFPVNDREYWRLHRRYARQGMSFDFYCTGGEVLIELNKNQFEASRHFLFWDYPIINKKFCKRIKEFNVSSRD